MIIQKLIIHNFFTFEHVDIDLGEGPFFVTGNNRDSLRAMSNGAGKSMLFQSILWCWFDDVLREGLLKDDVIGAFDDFCQVYTKIEKDGRIIEIDRVRKHKIRGNSVIVKLDGQNISKHKDKDNLPVIESLLGITTKTVYYSCYSSRAFPSFMTLSPAKMKETVSEILDISRFDKHISGFAKKTKEIKVQLEKLWQEHKFLSDNKKEILQEISKLELYIKNISISNQTTLNSLENKIKEFNLELDNYKEKIIDQDDLSKIKEEKETIEEFLQSINEVNGKLKELELKKSRNVSEKDRCLKDVSSIVSKIEDSKNQLLNLTCSVTGRCNYCNSEMTDKQFIENKIIELNSLIEATEIELLEKKAYLTKLDANIENNNNRIKKYREFLTESQGQYTRHKELSDILNLQNSIKTSINNCIKQIENTEQEILRIQNTSSENYESLLEEKKTKLKNIEVKLEDLTSKILVKDDEGVFSDKISLAFKEIKSGVFNNFVLDFCNSINSNLEDLTDGVFKCSYEVKGEELKFTFTDSSKYGKQLPFSALSDGERCLVSKAVSASLSEIINTGIIIDDEGLDGADSSVIPFIVDFTLNKYKGRTFFFVGHQPILNELFQGYTNIHIVKENGKSKVYKNE